MKRDEREDGRMEYIIEEASYSEAPMVSLLVNRVFDEFVGVDYSPEGIETFKSFASTESIQSRMRLPNSFTLVAKADGAIVGVLETRDYSHISLLFIDEAHQGRGLSRRLFERAKEGCLSHDPKLREITVNSSGYAIRIYAALGFTTDSEMQEKNGIMYLPMTYRIRGRKRRLNLIGLGDVGSNCLIGLRLLGGDVIDSIGIYDPDPMRAKRYEAEINQVHAEGFGHFPKVSILKEEELFDCDVFAFCASRAVPEIGSEKDGGMDVRKRQFAGNAAILKPYVTRASETGFKGIFAVISDPVDQLCQAVLEMGSLKPEQIKGFGLGVMKARARYLAEQMGYPVETVEAFGPHGKGLVIANAVDVTYDPVVSAELTKATETFNLKVREWGFKPFIAPALSSAALSIIGMLRGDWHYSTYYMEKTGIFFGCRNRWQGEMWIPFSVDMDVRLRERNESTQNFLRDEWESMRGMMP